MSGDQVGNMTEVSRLSQEVAALLTKTLTPDRSAMRAAEEGLIKLEAANKLYGLATLYLTRRDDLSSEVHTAAAIAFKNFIRRNWRYDPSDETSDQVDKIDTTQRDMIKQHIIEFMLSSPAHIQRQLSEAISIIGHCDFPDKWPTLIVELEKFLASSLNQNFNTLQGILHTAHSITRRYRFELPSDRLWSEIKLVVTHFGQPLTDRFKDLNTVRTLCNQSNELTSIYHSLLLCAKIYHNLITQDLPEFFEDRLADWIPHLLDLLTVQLKLSVDMSVVEDLKSEICEIAGLFVQRYSDAENFKAFTQKFAENIWNLLVTTNQDTQYDTLVSTAIRYLVIVADRPETRNMFQDQNVLNLLCQNVIIPNLTFRDIDEELFEDDPEEYVRRDIEGSDVDTRRRAACDLVLVLCKFQEVQLVEIFGQYIQEMLKQYNEDKLVNWKPKDLAIFSYSAMAIKGSTRQHGTVSISQHVNIVKFFEDNIVNELVNEAQTVGANVLKADAFRFITIFRNYIPMDRLIMHLPLIVKHITSSNVVVRTYSSITLEKLLTIRDPVRPQSTAFKSEQIEPYLGELIRTLFDALELPDSGENEHIMKTIMRLFSFSRSNLIVQFLPSVLPRLTNKLGIVARNPSKPYFNHYLFETLALTIRAACSVEENPSIRAEFEGVLFNILEVVLAQDVQEFTPYVLQLLNIILQVQNVGSVSESFIKLFHDLLSPAHWEKPANVRPLTDLMHTYIQKISQQIVTEGKLDPLLGIFQKLIASKSTDHEGLALLQSMMVYIPASEFDSRIKGIFMLIFQRLTGSKTTKFVKHTLECFSLYAFLRGADSLASSVNQLQDKIFGMVIEKLFITDLRKVTGAIERRICICGVIKILSQLPLIDNGAYNSLWAPLLIVLMEMFELPQETIIDEDDHFVDVTESLDFQAQYSKLNFASKKRDDPTKEVGDLKLLLASSLANLSIKLPGFVPKVLRESLNQDAMNCLMNYCKAANVAIV